jgi:hypothetical protein
LVQLLGVKFLNKASGQILGKKSQTDYNLEHI